MMRTMLEKLKSRKLWACIAGVVMGLGMVFGLDANTVETVSGAVVALGSVITYIAVEGKVDAAGVADAISKAQEAYEEVVNGE